MGITVQDTPLPPPALLALLEKYVPQSLPLLRRLQFTARLGGTTADTHILFASREGDDAPDLFAAAYVDLAKGPETEMWAFCSLEGSGEPDRWQDGEGSAEQGEPRPEVERGSEAKERVGDTEQGSEATQRLGDGEQALEAMTALLRRVKSLDRQWDGERQKRKFEGTVMVGSLDERVRSLLLERGVRTKYWNPHDKVREDFVPFSVPVRTRRGCCPSLTKMLSRLGRKPKLHYELYWSTRISTAATAAR